MFHLKTFDIVLQKAVSVDKILIDDISPHKWEAGAYKSFLEERLGACAIDRMNIFAIIELLPAIIINTTKEFDYSTTRE